MTRVSITTMDNPYDPFTNFNDWFFFDVLHGYNTCQLLARIANTSDSLSDEENEYEMEEAIDEIIKYDFLNIYKKVKREQEETE